MRMDLKRTETDVFQLTEQTLQGVNLIEASAGTGKTHTIERICAALILEKNLSLDKILIVTFTEAATLELRERIFTTLHSLRDQLLSDPNLREDQNAPSEKDYLDQLIIEGRKDSKLRDRLYHRLNHALLAFDDASIHTIHGFCQKILTEFAFECGSVFEIELMPEQNRLIEMYTRDYWRRIFDGETDHAKIAFIGKVFSSPAEMNKLLNLRFSNINASIQPEYIEHSAEEYYKKYVYLYSQVQKRWNRASREVDDEINRFAQLKKQSANKALRSLKGVHSYFEQDINFEHPEGLKILFEYKKKDKQNIFQSSIYEFAELLEDALNAAIFSLQQNFLEDGVKKLADQKKQNHVRTFDDLLFDLHDALNSDSGDSLKRKIRERYGAALIDEFQDTDKIQYSIFRSIFQKGKQEELFKSDAILFFIGDPKQSIYQFRGADIYTYLSAQDDLGVHHKTTLQTNWRSDGDLVCAVNCLFQQANSFHNQKIEFFESKAQKEKNDRSFYIKEGKEKAFPSPLQIWFTGNDDSIISVGDGRNQIINATVGEVVRLLNGSEKGRLFLENISDPNEPQQIFPKDIAILVRRHQEAALLQKALKKQGVPSVIKSRETLFQSGAFQEFCTILFAIANYRDESMLRGALITEILGFDGEKLRRFIADEPAWEARLNRFHQYYILWQNDGFFEMAQSLLHEESIRERLLSTEFGERKLTDLLQSIEVLHELSLQKGFGISGLIQWINNQEFSELSQDEQLIRLETDEDSLKIVTVHGSKGLQYPIIFCPFLWSGISKSKKNVLYHDDQKEYQYIWDFSGSSYGKKRVAQELLEEETRLIYVALTRAKHMCYIAWGKINQCNSSALSHLLNPSIPTLTAKEFKEKTVADLINEIKRLVPDSNHSIEIRDIPQPTNEIYSHKDQSTQKLDLPLLQRKLNIDWMISSFSSLSKQKVDHLEGIDHDQNSVSLIKLKDTKLQESENNRFSLPPGAQIGNCLHEILEEISFEGNNAIEMDRLILGKLEKYQFDGELWGSVVKEMLSDLWQAKLVNPYVEEPFVLKDLNDFQKVTEMEFYYSLRSMDSTKLLSLIQQLGTTPSHNMLGATLSKLEFHTLKGFLKGFIDLVFEWNGRFYIVDWKSNLLGLNFEEYDQQNMNSAIQKHSYNLQYYLYALALQSYLKQKVSNYNFEQHFGGVYLFFLRGVSPKRVGNGIYYDSLSQSGPLLEAIEKLITS